MRALSRRLPNGHHQARPSDAADARALLEECRTRALALLRANLGPLGIRAAATGSQAHARAYDAVFARDAGVCALAMLRSGQPELIRGVRLSLETLALHQADNGQIPKFVRGRNEADFWYVGCIDATLWWLIALAELEAIAPAHSLRTRLKTHVGRALTWLRCQEHPRLQLLSQNEASDWADIMPRSGYVLYTNALWYHVKRVYRLPGAAQTVHHFNHLFFPFARDVSEYRRVRLLADYARAGAKTRELYLSYVNFSFFGDEGDVFGNVLAVSPTAWWDNFVTLTKVAALPGKVPVKIWVDIGSREGDNAVSGARRLRDALEKKGWKLGSDLEYVEQEGGEHDEISWGSRVEGMLLFLYGTEARAAD